MGMGMGMGGRMDDNMGGTNGYMMGGHMGMSGGMNMSFGYHNNMNNFSNRPRFKSIGRGVGGGGSSGGGSSGGGSSGGPIFSHPKKILTLSEVQNWLEKQQPYISGL